MSWLLCAEWNRPHFVAGSSKLKTYAHPDRTGYLGALNYQGQVHQYGLLHSSLVHN